MRIAAKSGCDKQKTDRVMDLGDWMSSASVRWITPCNKENNKDIRIDNQI